jgi:hypothetical protein
MKKKKNLLRAETPRRQSALRRRKASKAKKEV